MNEWLGLIYFRKTLPQNIECEPYKKLASCAASPKSRDSQFCLLYSRDLTFCKAIASIQFKMPLNLYTWIILSILPDNLSFFIVTNIFLVIYL